MQTIEIPIAQKLNSEASPGSHAPTDTPYIKNMRLEYGKAKKRFGHSVVYEATAPILGAFVASKTCMILAIADSAGSADGKLYTWDMDLSSVSITPITDGTFKTGYDATTGKYNKFRFTNHYDPRTADLNSASLEPCMVTVITNGITDTTPFMYRHQVVASPSLIALPSTYTIDTKDAGAKLRAKYVASFKDVIYWAGITGYDGYTATLSETARRTIWSKVKDISNYSQWSNYKDFLQRGDAITGILPIKDALFVGRDDCIEVTAGGYGVFDTFSNDIGCTGQEGMINYRDRLLCCYRGKIMVPGDVQPHLSRDIHTLFAGQDAGTWEDVTGLSDSYSELIYYSTGKKLFPYSFKHGSWYHDEFEDDVKIIGNIGAGDNPWKGWASPLSLHTNLSIVEEDLLSDPFFILGGTKLCKMNHFYENRTIAPAEGDDDSAERALYEAWAAADGDSYESIYETPLIPLGDGYTMGRGLEIYGESAGAITVKGFYCDAPKKPTFTTLGTVVLNSDGYAQFDIDSGRTKYAAFQLSTNDVNNFELSRLALLVQQGGRK